MATFEISALFYSHVLFTDESDEKKSITES